MTENPMNHRIATWLALLNALALFAAPAARAAETNAPALADLLGQLKTASASTGDSTLKSLGNEVVSKAKSLSKSLSTNSAAQAQLQTAVQSVLGNKAPDALAGFQKLTEAKLTPQQSKLAKELGDVGSAYLVQNNLGNLEGSQTDVALVVKSLRKGNLTDTLPPIQRIGQNAKLTPPQKELLTGLSERYAPGAEKLRNALGDGLKSLPSLGK